VAQMCWMACSMFMSTAERLIAARAGEGVPVRLNATDHTASV